jgi:hypothetical protein
MTERLAGPVEPHRHRVAEGDCTNCGKPVRLHTPQHGDGSILVTYWHKDARDRSRWCRSFVEDGIRWVLA